MPSDHQKRLGLYLAALGSEKLRIRIEDPTNDAALVAAFDPLGITQDMIQQVRMRLDGSKKLKDSRDEDPCPFPPCPDYVGAVIAAVTR
jgi:hypothetical protein